MLSIRTRAGWGLVVLLFVTACKGKDATPTAPSGPPSGSQPVYFTAIGASDAIGFGGSVACVPFSPCPDGTGYVQIIARRLADGREVNTTNLGVPGSVLSAEIQALGASVGRTIPGNFVQGQAPFVPRNSTLVTIFAGGNDTNTIGAAVEAGQGGSDPRAFIDAQVQGFGRSFDALLQTVRDRAPAARIVVANLPNMAGLPYASGYSLVRRQGLQRIAVGISSTVVNRLTTQNVVVVDLMCDARVYDASFYSSDGFHPNDRGYAYIADRFLAAIQAAAPPVPSSGCAQTTVVPAL